MTTLTGSALTSHGRNVVGIIFQALNLIPSRTVHAGDYFGDLGPLLGTPRSATVRARSDEVLRGFNTRGFRARSVHAHGKAVGSSGSS